MKTVLLGSDGVNGRALKGFSLDEFVRRWGGKGALTRSPHGLAAAYSASVWSYTCIVLRAQTIAGVPIVITGDDGEPLPNHPLNAVFSDYASDLIWRIEAALLIWGKTYLEVARNMLGMPASLHWLNSQAITRKAATAGGIVFDYSPGANDRTRSIQQFSEDEIVYLHYFDPDDDWGGLSPLAVALTSVGADRDTVRHTQAFFSNGARLDGILSIPDAGDDVIDRVEAKWRSIFRGVQNAFRTLIVGSNSAITYTPVTAPPVDLALAAVKAETRRDVCAAFRVPPALAGAWEAANYAASVEQRRSFYVETILPEIDFIEDGLNRELSKHWPGARIKFDVSGLTPVIEDEARRNQAVTMAVQGGWMTVNEARVRSGLPSVPDGDVFVPMPGAAQMPTGLAGDVPYQPVDGSRKAVSGVAADGFFPWGRYG